MKPGDTYYDELTTRNFTTGQVANADSLPTITVSRNGTDDPAVVAAVTLVDTGRYEFEFTIPSGYAYGDTLVVSAAATVGGVSDKDVVARFVLEPEATSLVVSPATLGAPSSASSDVLAYADLVSHLQDIVSAASNDAANARRLRRAIQTAYRLVSESRRWTYLTGVYRLDLQAPAVTGTIAYDKATNTVTLTGSTWPSWAADGTLRVGSVKADVSSRDSDTVLTLDAVNTFAADIAAGTAYTLFQTQYPLPSDFRSMCDFVLEQGLAIGSYLSPEAYNRMTRWAYTQGRPVYWTILGDSRRAGGRVLAIWPAPSRAETMDLVYDRDARRLVKSGETAAERTGTLSGTAGALTVTGSGTIWNNSMAGALLRISNNSKVPDGLDGLNPFAEQIFISSATSTTITLKSALSNDYAGAGFVISDPVDIAPFMIPALLRCCEWQMAILLERGNVSEAQGRYYEAARRAFEADNVDNSQRYVGRGSGGRVLLGAAGASVTYPDGTTWP